ncbi:hypothetical protein ACWEQN_32045 [Streptomyces sp. NPDC004129]
MRPESEQRDRVEKRCAYAEAGILVYLPIDWRHVRGRRPLHRSVTLDTEPLKDWVH